MCRRCWLRADTYVAEKNQDGPQHARSLNRSGHLASHCEGQADGIWDADWRRILGLKGQLPSYCDCHAAGDWQALVLTVAEEDGPGQCRHF